MDPIPCSGSWLPMSSTRAVASRFCATGSLKATSRGWQIKARCRARPWLASGSIFAPPRSRFATPATSEPKLISRAVNNAGARFRIFASAPQKAAPMTEPDVYDGLTRIFNDAFLRDDLALLPHLAPKDIEGWDSFKHIEIVLAVEEHFDIKMSVREVDGVKTIGDLAQIILAKTRGA